jgi:hypothetical protein
MLFVVLLFARALFARGNHGWERVEKLKPGSTVLFSLWSRETVSGRVETVSPTVLQLRTFDREDIGITQLQEFVAQTSAGLSTSGRICPILRDGC